MLLLGVAFIACGLAASCIEREPGRERDADLRRARVPLVRLVERGLDRREHRVDRRGLSLFDRFYGFAQGVIDLRDVVFFVAFTRFSCSCALRALGARTWRGIA
jgi:hypothetical protein